MAVFCHLALSRFFDFKLLPAAILEEFNDDDGGSLRLSHRTQEKMASDLLKKRCTRDFGTLKTRLRPLDAPPF
jgi:hypothetical protein